MTYNGVAQTATFVNSGQLTILLNASDQATAGSYPVAVTSPAPGGGPSNSVNFAVNNPVPAINKLSPASATAGAAAQTLTINGTNFLSSSTVTYDGVAHTATFVNSGQLTILLSASDQATTGSFPVVVTSPAPGGGSSNSSNFAVNAPTGVITVNIGGLPTGVSASVAVAGPAGFSQQLTQTTPLTVSPGTYTLTATIVSSNSVANTVFVPTISGSPVTVAVNGAATVTVSYATLSTLWQPVGPSAVPIGGLLWAGKSQTLAIDNKNPLVMYTGGGSARGTYTEPGIYKTVDGGNTWTQIDTGLTDPAVDELWLDQSNPSVILASTHTTGIFRSADAGAHWSLAGSFGNSTDILQVGGTIYAGTAKGIAESTDDGATWTITEPISASTQGNVSSLSSEGGAIYAGLWYGQVLIKLNSSAGWVSSLPAGVSNNTTVWSVAVNPTNPNKAFVVEWDNYLLPSLYVTANGGSTWQPVVNGQFDVTGFAPQTVFFDPVSSVLYAAGDNLGNGSAYQSSDGGSTWAPIPGANWNSRLVVPDAGGATGNLILGGDSGLFSLPNGATTWQSLNGNLTTSSSTSFDVSGSTLIARVQDQPGSFASFNGGASWQQSYGGESGYIAFNPGNPQYAYIFDRDAGFQYSKDGGHTFTAVANLPASEWTDLSGTGELLATDTKNPSTVYLAAANGVFKSTDWGVDWTPQSSWPTAQPVMVVVDPTNSNKIFVGTGAIYQAGSLQFTTNGGKTWTTSTLGVPADCGSPISLAVDPANPSVVLVGMSEVNLEPLCGVLRSTDGGNTFSLVTNGMQPWVASTENGAIPSIRFDPSGSGIVAVAHQSGLYLSSDLGKNWTNIRGNAVPYVFTGVTWSGGYLYASTDGEGVVRMPFSF